MYYDLEMTKNAKILISKLDLIIYYLERSTKSYFQGFIQISGLDEIIKELKIPFTKFEISIFCLKILVILKIN
jgi:hypothetical protein